MGPGEYVLVKPNELFARPLRPGSAGLHPLHRAQPPLSRRGDAAADEGLDLAKEPQPYSEDDLNAIAARCTLMEDNARKVEREMQKRIAAVVLHPRIGQSFPPSSPASTTTAPSSAPSIPTWMECWFRAARAWMWATR